MNRIAAAEADLKVGSIVFKGNGKVAYKVWKIQTWTPGCGRMEHPTYYALQTLTSKSAPAAKFYRAEQLTVEAPAQTEKTGIDTLRDLLSLD